MEQTETEIIQRLDRLATNDAEIKADLGQLKNDVAYIKGQLDSQQKAVDKIPEFAEKVGELKNWRQIAVIVITGSISSILAWLIKN